MSEQIKRMLDGNLEEIRKGMISDIPIIVMNAIVGGAENRITDPQYIKELVKQKENETELLHVRIGDVATAALDVLGVEHYNGDKNTILELIKTHFKKAAD